MYKKFHISFKSLNIKIENILFPHLFMPHVIQIHLSTWDKNTAFFYICDNISIILFYLWTTDKIYESTKNMDFK